MLRLRAFEYVEARDLQDACRLLQEGNGKAAALAGGTDLLVRQKQAIGPLRRMVNIKRIPGIRGIHASEDGRVEIGPLTSLSEIESSPLVRERYPALACAAACVATPQIRNVGTLGGNICQDARCWYVNRSSLWRKATGPCLKLGEDVCHHIKGGQRCLALFLGDTVPPLIALDAEIDMVGATGGRRLPLGQFYTGRGEQPNILCATEIVSKIILPLLPSSTAAGYMRFALRGEMDYLILGLAVRLTRGERDQVYPDARVILIGARPGPLRLRRAEAVLVSGPLTRERLEAVADAASRESRPVPNRGFSAWYLRAMVRTLVKRGVEKALQSAAPTTEVRS
ncbi:MAG: FAD binding domain-containing protein [Candidatus Binatia bacterium]